MGSARDEHWIGYGWATAPAHRPRIPGPGPGVFRCLAGLGSLDDSGHPTEPADVLVERIARPGTGPGPPWRTSGGIRLVDRRVLTASALGDDCGVVDSTLRGHFGLLDNCAQLGPRRQQQVTSQTARLHRSRSPRAAGPG